MSAASDQKPYFQKRVNSLVYAWKGIKKFFLLESHAKIHFSAACIALFLAGYYQVAAWEWVAIISSIAVVIASEMLNSALEQVVDVLFPNQHQKAEIIKDISAGAVLILAIGAMVIGCIVFLPHVLQSLE